MHDSKRTCWDLVLCWNNWEYWLLDNEDDNIDWDKMPLIGPATYEEAIAQIETAEQEIAKGEVYDWKDVLEEARQRILSYAH